MSTSDLHHRVEGPVAPDLRRRGQLTFTSFDGGGGAGWQIKESKGLTEQEIALLRSGIDARLDAAVDLPRFPSAGELSAFPRRLVFGADLQLGDSARAWWHHAPAGLDGSGRPGNVFTHVLLDYEDDRAPVDLNEPFSASRPIDWWRSRDWLTPYGPEAVRDARLPATEPRPGTAISADGVVDFLFDDDDHRRPSVLRVLLDACAAALAGGPPVVLATQSTDRAAQWIAAVTYLTSASTAQRLSFSTLERPDSLATRLQQGVRLCCVPLVDLDRLADPARGYVLLADDRELSAGELDGEPHRTAAGDVVVVTEWSALVRVLLLDPATSSWALSEISRIGAAAPATPRYPGWPVAMLVSANQESFPDGVAAASRVVPNTPDGATAEQLAAAREFIERRDLTVTMAWAMLDGATHPGEPLGGMAEQVLGIYLMLAVGDVERLSQPGGPPLPAATWQTKRWLTASVLSALTDAGEALRHEPEGRRAAAATLGLATLVWRLGLLPEYADQLTTEAERLVWPLLVSAGGADFAASVGPVPEEVMDSVVRPAVSDEVQHREIGRGLDRAVLTWLYPRGPTSTGSPRHDRLRVELAYQSWFADPLAYANERPMALSGALWHWKERGWGPGPGELAAKFSDPPWPPSDLAWVESSLPGLLPVGTFGPVIKSADAGPGLDRMVEIVSARPGWTYPDHDGLRELIDLRRLSRQRWWVDPDLLATLDRVLAGGVAGLAYPSVPFDDTAIQTLKLAILLASTAYVDHAGADRLIASRAFRPGPAAPEALAALNEAVGREISVAHVAVAAILGEPRFPEGAMQCPGNHWAAGVTIARHGGRLPILKACLLDQADREGHTVSTLQGPVRDLLAQVRRETRVGWQMFAVTEKYAQSWLKMMLPGDGWFSRRH